MEGKAREGKKSAGKKREVNRRCKRGWVRSLTKEEKVKGASYGREGAGREEN